MSVNDPINVASARHRVVTILRITAGCILIASVTLYHHVRETRRVNDDLVAARMAIRARKQQYVQRSLANQIAEAEQRNQQLEQAWEQHRLQVDTFHGMLPERVRVAAGEDARIDFKVALFNARETLQALAQESGVKLTDDLGIAETIATEDDTETRLWELGAVIRLVELLISSGVATIDTIEALPPFVYAEVPDENEHTLAFPVRVSLQCSYAQLYPLLSVLSREECFYAISQCDISRPTTDSNHLRVQLVCSALRFLVGSADTPETEGRSSRRQGGRG